MGTTTPRGVRNNNPGNLEWNPRNKWQGLIPVAQRTDPRFCEFTTPAFGIRAIAVLLINYQDFHGITTVQGAINRWAPPVENDTGAYVRAVQKAVGGDPVDMYDYDDMFALVSAIIRHENGRGPLPNTNTWYRDDVIDEGLRMAGVRKNANKVPVTKEAVGATATGAVGALELADALPGVVGAVKGAEEHLSSGDLTQIVTGLVLIGIAVFIAYSQVKRHKSGQL